MNVDTTVLLTLHSPREKVWGRLLDLTAAGVTVRGIDLNGFEDWLKQWGSEDQGGLTTLFFPLHRVEKMELDESSGGIPSLEERFTQRIGMTLKEYLQRP